MRKIGLVLVLLALAVGFGIPAQAGPPAGKVVGLYLAYYPDTDPEQGNSKLIKPLVQVGSVVFRPVDGEMHVDITLDKGRPDEDYRGFLVHRADWPDAVEIQTTDGDGNAEWEFNPEIPEDAKGSVFIKAIVRVDRHGPVYATEQLHIRLPKK